MTLIAYISLAIAAMLSLLGLLRRDTAMLQRNQFSNSRYYSYLLETSDLTTPSRLTAIVVLIGSFTTWAKDSWMVVVVLAVALAVTGIYLLTKKQEPRPNKRAAVVLVIAIVLALLATAPMTCFEINTSQSDAAQTAGSMLLVLTIASPLLVMLSNWLTGLFYKNGEKTAGEDAKKS